MLYQTKAHTETTWKKIAKGAGTRKRVPAFFIHGKKIK